VSAALPIAALAALALTAKLRRGSRSWSDVDPLEQAKAEAERLAGVMREERDKVRRRDQDLNSRELTEEVARKVWLRFPELSFDYGNDRIVTRSRTNPKVVIKLAPAGGVNLDEAAAYNGAGPEARACLVPVLAHAKNGDWLIMEYAKPASMTSPSSPETPCARRLRALGFLDLEDFNMAQDGRALDYGEPVDTRGSAARRPVPRKQRHPLTDEERLDILGLAADEGMVSFSGGCGAVALAMREVLFDGQAEVVAAVNRHLWRQGRAVGHVGVRDLGGTIWDGEGTYEGDAVEEFLAWGMLDFSDPDHGLSSEEQAEEVLLLEGEEALAAAGQMPCPARAPDPGRVLRAARAAVEGRRKK
jgi:hypothetical protein